MTNQPYQPGIDPTHPQMPPAVKPKKPMSTIAIILFVAAGGALISIGWAGIQWASLHEPSLGNALAGRQLYADAEVIRILSIVGFLAGIASIAYPIVRAVRPK